MHAYNKNISIFISHSHTQAFCNEWKWNSSVTIWREFSMFLSPGTNTNSNTVVLSGPLSLSFFLFYFPVPTRSIYTLPFFFSPPLPYFSLLLADSPLCIHPSSLLLCFNPHVCQQRLQTSWPHVYAVSVRVCIPGRPCQHSKQRLSVNLVCFYKRLKPNNT